MSYQLCISLVCVLPRGIDSKIVYPNKRTCFLYLMSIELITAAVFDLWDPEPFNQRAAEMKRSSYAWDQNDLEELNSSFGYGFAVYALSGPTCKWIIHVSWLRETMTTFRQIRNGYFYKNKCKSWPHQPWPKSTPRDILRLINKCLNYSCWKESSQWKLIAFWVITFSNSFSGKSTYFTRINFSPLYLAI